MKTKLLAHQLLRRKAVSEISALPQSTLYKRISDGLWTKPVSLGSRCVAWPATDIEALNTARIAGNSDDEIRLLVKQLESSRNINSIGSASNEKS